MSAIVLGLLSFTFSQGFVTIEESLINLVSIFLAMQPLTESSLGTQNPEVQPLKYGERVITEGELITFPNPRIGRIYEIQISLPEFTCKCPFSGYPDFATILITYVPQEKVVELKAIKLYINSYRDRYISHEEAVNQILDDFVAACDPISATVKGDFNPRGNVHMVVEVHYRQSADSSPPEDH